MDRLPITLKATYIQCCCRRQSWPQRSTTIHHELNCHIIIYSTGISVFQIQGQPDFDQEPINFTTLSRSPVYDRLLPTFYILISPNGTNHLHSASSYSCDSERDVEDATGTVEIKRKHEEQWLEFVQKHIG